jgi:type I restriction-modification system DNA methylase subunit/predicted type IV restriction endonuclease
MALPAEIARLIETFERNRDAYLKGRYSETQLRREFIDPLFKALGWDVDNTRGWAEAYKEVIHEDAIRIGSATKAPDYCFRIGGARKFFVEAKAPSVNLKDDPSPAYQLRRYAWSAKLPLSILTDFDEFAVYDCRIRPSQADKASKGRIKYLSYKEYPDRWDEIAAIFSRDAVLKGSFDKYAVTEKRKQGTAEVDAAFLGDIETWRDMLAHNIALRNSALNNRQLNYAVQITIDRIIFLRICEDRGIERYGELMGLINGSDVYQRLMDLFRKADDRYNSGLFHFQREKDRPEGPDELTPELIIDDKPLKEILRALYYPCPYVFSVIPPEILGQVYEQFLGKVITLTAGHHARVEDKPEVKKAGGVFYTPAYIVDHIVKHTVGKLLEGCSVKLRKTKPPKLDRPLRVLDPACGSGSFLLGAYQFLLDWYLNYYTQQTNPDEWLATRHPPIYQAGVQGWKLALAERKRILLDHIFGVDIDTQAVEVTKLSLLLRVLEGEKSLVLFYHERALPDLAANIKCGNSLIGPDFYKGQQLAMFDEEERFRINVFDWKAEFPDIFGDGGFDAVIGNPPYIPIELMRESERIYYQGKHSQLERKYDSAPVFILAMLKNLQEHALLGFISSVTWQTGENYSKLREHLFTYAGIVTLINLPFDVFKNAYVDTGVYILARKPTSSYSIYRFPKKEKVSHIDDADLTEISTDLIQSPDYKIILEPKVHQILIRTTDKERFEQLGAFTISTQGLAGNRFEITDSAKGKQWCPFLQKGQARRYLLDIDEIVYANMGDKFSLRRFYTAVPKLLIRRVISRQDRLLVAYTDKELVFKKDINPFIVADPLWNTCFVLGVLNSRLISYLYVNSSSIATKDDFRQTTLAELRSLPIPKVFRGDTRHDQIVELVEAMLELHKGLASAKTPNEKETIQRQIAAMDAQIDQLVYELYSLTDEEIRIVEGATQ